MLDFICLLILVESSKRKSAILILKNFVKNCNLADDIMDEFVLMKIVNKKCKNFSNGIYSEFNFSCLKSSSKFLWKLPKFSCDLRMQIWQFSAAQFTNVDFLYLANFINRSVNKYGMFQTSNKSGHDQ